MPNYKVMVDDNFHYMDLAKRWEYGTYDTLAEAMATCRQLVDRSLLERYKPGMTAAQLHEQYAFFGDDPFIVGVEGSDGRVPFSARDYARERVDVLCAEGHLAHFDPSASGRR